MNRERLLAEVEDIDRLCRARELRTAEIFAPNAFYGNDLVLKRHAGLPPDLPLKTVVPHGIVFDRSYVWETERRAPLPAILAYSEYRVKAYSRSTNKLLIRSAVPFAYLPGMLGEAEPRLRSGTVFFPGHSSHRMTAQSDFAGMAERLTRIEAKYQPVTVCIYWRDYELGRHMPFVERGLRVVSAGHMFDPAFLFRLFSICQAHRYAAANHIASSLTYSVLAGCSFFLLPGFGVTYTGAAQHVASDLSHGGDVLDALAGAFASPVDGDSARQSSLVAGICGLDHLLSAQELRDSLRMAERLDRFGVARDPRRRRLHVAFPRRYLRAGWNFVRAVRRRAGALARLMRAYRTPQA